MTRFDSTFCNHYKSISLPSTYRQYLYFLPRSESNARRKSALVLGERARGITKAANLNAFYIALFMRAGRQQAAGSQAGLARSKKGAHDANKQEHMRLRLRKSI